MLDDSRIKELEGWRTWQAHNAVFSRSDWQPPSGFKAIIARSTALFLRRFPVKRGKERVGRIIGPYCLNVPVNTKLGFLFLANFSERTNRLTFQGKFGRVRWFVEEVVQPGSLFIDIGANQGAVSLMASQRVGSSGYVWSFEPSEKIFAVLQKNVLINRVNNLTAYCCALGEETGLSFIDDENDRHLGSAHVSEKGSRILVLTGEEVFLPDRIPNASQIFLKIDTEGYESHVLRGMPSLLEDDRLRAVCIEIDEKHLNRFGRSTNDVYSIMGENGFESTVEKEGSHYDQIFIRT